MDKHRTIRLVFSNMILAQMHLVGFTRSANHLHRRQQLGDKFKTWNWPQVHNKCNEHAEKWRGGMIFLAVVICWQQEIYDYSWLVSLFRRLWVLLTLMQNASEQESYWYYSIIRDKITNAKKYTWANLKLKMSLAFQLQINFATATSPWKCLFQSYIFFLRFALNKINFFAP